MHSGFCGIDFGTSNSAISAGLNDSTRLIPLEGGQLTMPSAVFFNTDHNNTVFGRQAVTEYLDGYSGRLLRALKSILGSSLVQESTQIGFKKVSFSQIVGLYIARLKAQAEKEIGTDIENVIMGRPVHFIDGDEQADKNAENQLRVIAAAQGFKNIAFEFEPIAAAKDYESTLDKEELVLVVDIGGGTSDFTVIRLSPAARTRTNRQDDILANGGVHLGGIDFDKQFSLARIMPDMGYKSFLESGLDMPLAHYHTLATWHLINSLYTQKNKNFIQGLYREAADKNQVARLMNVIENQRGHELANAVETLKISLSESENASISLGFIEGDWRVHATRTDLNNAIKKNIARIVDVAGDTTTRQAGITPAEIGTVFMTGGSTGLHGFKEAIQKKFPQSRLVQGDKFSSVAKGLGLSALNSYGSPAR